MQMKRGVIFAGGEFSAPADLEKILADCELIVCADSGFDSAVKAGATPDVIIGDMDSVKTKLPENTDIIKLKCEKDDTDTEAAIDYLISAGCDEIVLLGALGGRVDHELANIMLVLYAAQRGAKLIIKTEDTEVMLVEKYAEISGKKGDILTLIPVKGDAEGVSLSGLKYPLDNQTLPMGKTVGVSNEFVSDKARITAQKGLIVAVKVKR